MKKIYILLSCMILSVFSLGITVKAAVSNMTITVGQVMAEGENEILVPIDIANNKGLCGMTISIDYDDELVLKDVIEGTALTSLTMTKPGNFNDTNIKILWDGIDSDATNGTVANLVFANPQKVGTYPIKVSYVSGDILDGNINPVEAELVQGSIIIKERDTTKPDVPDNSCEKNGHKGNIEIRGAKKPTCEKDGYTGDTYCKVCNVKVKSGETIKATGHIFTNETIDKEATYTEPGQKSKHCANCDAVIDVQVIPVKEKETLELNEKVEYNNLIFKVTGVGKDASVEYGGVKNIKPSSVTIPATVRIRNVTYKITSVSENAFKNNKKITKVVIGNNVKSIGANAFAGCTKLKSIKIEKNVTTIGMRAFYGCKRLTSITLGSKVTTIGFSAFRNCTALTKLTIPSKVKKIGKQAFYGCKKLKSITIKTTKLTSKNVGKQAFKGTNTKATIKVPRKKLSAYKKLLKSKGISKKAKIKK